MARQLRICISKTIYHVLSRGNNKEIIFIEQSDYSKYFDLLNKYKLKFNYNLLCYALMPNHVHLIIRTSDEGTISQIMQGINLSYTLYFNRKYRRVGHVFQGRFKSFLVQSDSYLLELSRYVHLNPLRAKIVQSINSYPHTSYFTYIGKQNYRLIDKSIILSQIDQNEVKAMSKYSTFIDEEIAKGQVLLAKAQIGDSPQT